MSTEEQELDQIKTRKRLKLLFFLGPFPAGLSALLAFAGVDFPGWLIGLIFLVTFPLTVWHVTLGWIYSYKNVKALRGGKEM